MKTIWAAAAYRSPVGSSQKTLLSVSLSFSSDSPADTRTAPGGMKLRRVSSCVPWASSLKIACSGASPPRDLYSARRA